MNDNVPQPQLLTHDTSHWVHRNKHSEGAIHTHTHTHTHPRLSFKALQQGRGNVMGKYSAVVLPTVGFILPYQYFLTAYCKPTAYSLLFIEIAATRWHILKIKCTEFDIGWSSNPDPAGGSLQRSPGPLGYTSKRKW